MMDVEREFGGSARTAFEVIALKDFEAFLLPPRIFELVRISAHVGGVEEQCEDERLRSWAEIDFEL